jgi:hypothetical protein
MIDVDRSFTQAINAMGLFSNGATILASLVCFFSLAASMYANIYEQSKEIGAAAAS